MIDRLYKETEEKMKKVIENTEHEFATIRAGRPSLALLDGITVDAYGTPSTLKQVASINIPEPRMITIQAWDKNLIPTIEKAILKSNIGITPSNDGKIIRLTIAPLTEERRKELVKIIKHMAEEGRIAVRNIRRSMNEDAKDQEKQHEFSEDEYHIHLKKIQELTDKYVKLIDETAKHKEEDIMEV